MGWRLSSGRHLSCFMFWLFPHKAERLSLLMEISPLRGLTQISSLKAAHLIASLSGRQASLIRKEAFSFYAPAFAGKTHGIWKNNCGAEGQLACSGTGRSWEQWHSQEQWYVMNLRLQENGMANLRISLFISGVTVGEGEEL